MAWSHTSTLTPIWACRGVPIRQLASGWLGPSPMGIPSGESSWGSGDPSTERRALVPGLLARRLLVSLAALLRCGGSGCFGFLLGLRPVLSFGLFVASVLFFLLFLLGLQPCLVFP